MGVKIDLQNWANFLSLQSHVSFIVTVGRHRLNDFASYQISDAVSHSEGPSLYESLIALLDIFPGAAEPLERWCGKDIAHYGWAPKKILYFTSFQVTQNRVSVFIET